MAKSSVTEVQVGFPDLISAQVFWAGLEDPTQFHIARIHSGGLDGAVLAYLVVKNKE
jgi:hypothetical protein